jgi:ribosomal protein L7/L12
MPLRHRSRGGQILRSKFARHRLPGVRSYHASVEPDDAARLDRLERQVQFLLQHIGVDPDIAAADGAAFDGAVPMSGPVAGPAMSPDIVALVAAGKPIEAIKLYRQVTGAGLKEAKDVIDGMRGDLGLTRRR